METISTIKKTTKTKTIHKNTKQKQPAHLIIDGADLLYYYLTPSVHHLPSSHGGTAGDYILDMQLHGYFRTLPGNSSCVLKAQGYTRSQPYYFETDPIPESVSANSYLTGIRSFSINFKNAGSCGAATSNPQLNVYSHFWGKYTMGAETKWINNGAYQKDYRCNENIGSKNYNKIYDIGEKNIVLDVEEPETVIIRNISYRKEVIIVYSHDNWESEPNYAFAKFHTLLWGDKLEKWKFNIPGKQANTQFSICYKVAGKEFWENNFGNNYKY